MLVGLPEPAESVELLESEGDRFESSVATGTGDVGEPLFGDDSLRESGFQRDRGGVDTRRRVLDAAAEEAARRGTGARGLRAIMEETLLDAMYQLPAPNAVRCIVDGDAIVTSKAQLEYASDEAEPLQSQERKSA